MGCFGKTGGAVGSSFGANFTSSDFSVLITGVIFRASSSRTESFNIVPQLKHTDRVDAKFRLQDGQFIILKRIKKKC